MLIEGKADVNKPAAGYNNETPLQRAVEEGFMECAQLLVDAGASDPDGVFASINSPDNLLLQAARHKDVARLSKALELGANPDTVDTNNYGYTAMHWVTRCSYSAVH